jgi:2,5-dihydroxypyridine 5,6-dioxygenase
MNSAGPTQPKGNASTRPNSDDRFFHLVANCGGVVSNEKVLVIYDAPTRQIATAVAREADALGAKASLAFVDDLGRHGAEPPADVAAQMLTADLIICLCYYSLAHSRARLLSTATARFLSLPQCNDALFRDPAFPVDYQASAVTVRRFADAFTAGSEIRVKTTRGTDTVFRIDGRVGNYCPGFVRKPGDLGSPPDIEANISPIETSAEGRAVIDGSITCAELGLLKSPVNLELRGGRIVSISSNVPNYASILEGLVGPPESPRRVLAECGVGLNPKARLNGAMLIDEGSWGCVHFGFGANHAVGGRNEVDFHLDFVMREASLWVDGSPILQDGQVE